MHFQYLTTIVIMTATSCTMKPWRLKLNTKGIGRCPSSRRLKSSDLISRYVFAFDHYFTRPVLPDPLTNAVGVSRY